jgi:dTDP-4-amino-4,6-dideoxygalactose transaminase
MYKRYHHDVVGVNSRLDSIQAAVLNTKLPLLDFYNERRKQASLFYSKRFESNQYLITPIVKGNCQSHVFHQYTLRVINGMRDALADYLSELKIPFGIYYPIPLHRQKAYIDIRYNENDFKTSNLMSEQVISLPMHSELEEDQIDFICEKINKFFKDQDS